MTAANHTIDEKQDQEEALFEAIASLRSVEEVKRFITDLCTRKEIDEFSERWVIARLLFKGGHSYRDISAITGASTTTVGRVARYLQQEPHQGYKIVLERTRS